MKTIVFKLLLVFVSITANAQFKRAPFYEAYPELPVSMSEVAKNGFQLVSVWHEEYERSEGDESGLPWANQIKMYQSEKHMMRGKQMERSVYINENGERTLAYQYYYTGKLLLTIDEITFDSMQNEVINFTHNYAYKDTIPFQKVKMFNKDKRFRLLYDYMFDKEGRLIRLNITAHGTPQKEETLEIAQEDMELLLVAHSGDSKTERHYKNMHDLQFSERTQYNESGNPINKKIRDSENTLIYEIIYVYEDNLLSKSIHTRYEDKQPIEDKVMYYTFQPNGLPDRVIEEKGNLQTITSYQYYEEY